MFVVIPKTTCYDGYLHNVYIALCILSNLEIWSIQKYVRRLYANNTTPFYVRDLSIHRFWCWQGVLELTPEGTEGWLYLLSLLRCWGTQFCIYKGGVFWIGSWFWNRLFNLIRLKDANGSISSSQENIDSL